MVDRFEISAFGDAAVIVRAASPATPKDKALLHVLRARLDSAPPVGVTVTVAGLESLLVRFNPLEASTATLSEVLHLLLAQLDADGDLLVSGRRFQIPVVFGGEAGPDLEQVADELGLPESDVVDLITASTFEVAILAAEMAPMMEGAAYPRVRRHAEPRTNVPAGSVMIANANAVIQPFAGPTGWRVVGRTPHTIVDIGREPSAALQVGDEVRFVAIERAEAHGLEGTFLNPKATP